MNFSHDLFRQERERAGISKPRLAKMAGVALASIYNFEAGRTVPKPSTLQKIATFLGTDWRVFFTDDLRESVSPEPTGAKK